MSQYEYTVTLTLKENDYDDLDEEVARILGDYATRLDDGVGLRKGRHVLRDREGNRVGVAVIREDK